MRLNAVIAATAIAASSLADVLVSPVIAEQSRRDDAAIELSNATLAARKSLPYIEPLVTSGFASVADAFRSTRKEECGGYAGVLSKVSEWVAILVPGSEGGEILEQFESRQISEMLEDYQGDDLDVAEEQLRMDYAEVGGPISSLVARVMDDEESEGRIEARCLVMVFNSGNPYTAHLVLLSPQGDYIFGYQNEIFSPWAAVDHKEAGFDTLIVGDILGEDGGVTIDDGNIRVGIRN